MFIFMSLNVWPQDAYGNWVLFSKIKKNCPKKTLQLYSLVKIKMIYKHTNIYTYRTCGDESERAMHAVMYKRTLWGKQLCER